MQASEFGYKYFSYCSSTQALVLQFLSDGTACMCKVLVHAWSMFTPKLVAHREGLKWYYCYNG